jgi:putative ABC transport system permease protein
MLANLCIGLLVALSPAEFPRRTAIGLDGTVLAFAIGVTTLVGLIVGIVPALQASRVDLTRGFANPALWLMVRSRGDAAALARDVKNAIWSIDEDQPIVRVVTMEELVATSAAERRFALVLFEAFGFAALNLAATGIFGVLSGSVTERTREIGVRSALGGSRFDILGLIVRQGMALTGVGLALGLVGAMPASRALVTLLFGISPLDPLTYAGVMAMLLVVSIVACALPAWRAARVDPSIKLGAE